MGVRIVQFCRAYHDVMDEAFLRDFPGIEVLRPDSPAAMDEALAGAEILQINDSFFTPAVADAIRRHGQALKWIQFTTVGTDHAEAAGLPENVQITNIGDIRQKILAGHAMALMLALMRGVRAFEPFRARREWNREALFPHMMTPEGAHMLICGMGRIGQDIARKAKAFDMKITCATRATAPASPDIDRVIPREAIGEAIAEADVVMITAPLDDETRGMIGARELERMKPQAILVNVSRGPVVDEDALIRALAEGRIAGAGLDVFDQEPLPEDSGFWDLDNLILTPHMAGQGGDDQWHRLSELVRDNLRRYLDRQPLLNLVTPAIRSGTGSRVLP